MRRVLATTSLAEAHILCSALADHGLNATLENEISSTMAVGMPTAAVPVYVCVPESDLREAREFLAELRKPAAPASGEGAGEPEAPAGVARKKDFRRRLLWVVGGTLFLVALTAHPLFTTHVVPTATLGAWIFITVALLAYMRDLHPFVRVPGWRLSAFFAYGALGATSLAFLGTSVLRSWLGMTPGTAEEAFLVTGPVEELSKILGPVSVIGLVRAWRREPYEWFLGCAASGAGFAVVEDALAYNPFTFESAYGGVVPLLFRAATLLHIALSGAIGFGLGASRGTVGGFLLVTLLLLPAAAAAHGLWNAAAYSEETPGIFMVLLFLALVLPFLVGLRWAARSLAERSPDAPEAGRIPPGPARVP
jgi:RsiW-degrading membrane proteinase PrsW (M82 family)